MIVYHGTSKAGAADIIKRGIRMEASTLGYFGEGFYTTENKALAKSNYADFADDDEPGVVLAFEVNPRARLLDMRKERDWLIWRDGKFGDMIHRPGFAVIATEAGIDGLYDDSFEGWVFYNPKVLTPIRNNPAKPLPPAQTAQRMLELHGSKGAALWFANEAMMDAKWGERKSPKAASYWAQVIKQIRALP